MSDLSLPPLSLMPLGDEPAAPAGAAAPAAAGNPNGPFAWPTPDLASYPAPELPSAMPPCVVEGLNGKLLKGKLIALDPPRQLVQVQLDMTRRPMALRFDQFRRLRLADPLVARLTPPAVSEKPRLPYVVRLADGSEWRGDTVGHREEPWGLFLFEPQSMDNAKLSRVFMPRSQYAAVEIGLRIGEQLVAQQSITAVQIDEALAEQRQLREKKLGDLLVERQIITQGELSQAIAQQASMPMVRIGEALTGLGLISEAQLQDALQQQRSDRSVPLGALLVRRGVISQADLQTALARKMGYPLVDVQQFPTDATAVAKLPYQIASRIPALPLMVCNGRLVIAMSDPSNRRAIDEIEFAAQCKAVPVLARGELLLGAVDAAYQKVGAGGIDFHAGAGGNGAPALDFEMGAASELVATLETAESAAPDPDEPVILQSDNSLVRLINTMIVEAQGQGVSDIHIECEPGRDKLRIRFRRDGQLRPYLELPHAYHGPLIARIKIMCDLDISERRKPQDGKINFSRFVPGSRLELRVATIPTHGNYEDAVLRLLASSKPIPLDNLGLSPRNLAAFRQATSRPYGMVLCVGPTGSGKTTTLHSALSGINTPDRKIWTAEDPIEITQPGLRQVQVNPKIDWTFAGALRAFLRADPDVIMVGEIRDRETAQTAVEASLTGHLVLSTLHTNSAPETVTRLLDMGLDPFNFADALLAVLAQRLVRKLCVQCRQPHPARPEEMEELLQDWLHPLEGTAEAPAAGDVMAEWLERFGQDGRVSLYRPVGCSHCDQSGFRGRVGIHELMSVSRELRHMIQTGKRSDELQKRGLADGMRTLRQDGIEKVLAGLTTIEEVRASS